MEEKLALTKLNAGTLMTIAFGNDVEIPPDLYNNDATNLETLHSINDIIVRVSHLLMLKADGQWVSKLGLNE